MPGCRPLKARSKDTRNPSILDDMNRVQRGVRLLFDRHETAHPRVQPVQPLETTRTANAYDLSMTLQISGPSEETNYWISGEEKPSWRPRSPLVAGILSKKSVGHRNELDRASTTLGSLGHGKRILGS